MSLVEAEKFIEKMKSDSSLREQFAKLETWEEKEKFAEKAGFVFSNEELKQVLYAVTDQDLSDVAGGNNYDCKVASCTTDMCKNYCGHVTSCSFY